MLQELLDEKNQKTQTFQTVFLRDSASEIEVHEDHGVDFCRIQEHLRQGGSVFITSKPSQKLQLPTPKGGIATRKKKAAKKVTAYYYDHV